uniref:Uncharacterized protein n=1 Tax=Arundo donax TaxID=35708 RepID=A0A0A8ZJ06_ARUDO
MRKLIFPGRKHLRVIPVIIDKHMEGGLKDTT